MNDDAEALVAFIDKSGRKAHVTYGCGSGQCWTMRAWWIPDQGVLLHRRGGKLIGAKTVEYGSQAQLRGPDELDDVRLHAGCKHVPEGAQGPTWAEVAADARGAHDAGKRLWRHMKSTLRHVTLEP